MLKKLKDKRGVAIELCIIFIFIMASFCYIISLVSLKSNNRYRSFNLEYDAQIKVEQIGENFVVACMKGNGAEFAYENNLYITNVIDDPEQDYLELQVFRLKDNATVLTVDVDRTTNDVILWSFINLNSYIED